MLSLFLKDFYKRSNQGQIRANQTIHISWAISHFKKQIMFVSYPNHCSEMLWGSFWLCFHNEIHLRQNAPETFSCSPKVTMINYWSVAIHHTLFLVWIVRIAGGTVFDLESIIPFSNSDWFIFDAVSKILNELRIW